MGKEIGVIFEDTDVITVTPTVDTSAYASGDLLFDATEITNILSRKDGIATIKTITVIDKDDEGAALDILFTDDSTSWGTINEAVGPTDAVADGVQGVVEIVSGDYVDLANSQVVHKQVDIPVKGSGSSIWVVGIVRATPTYAAATDLVLRLGVKRD